MEPSHFSEKKQEIREEIWKKMKKKNIERFPYAWGRVPNFEGAERAAHILSETEEFRRARTVFVAPDSPQRPVRELVLHHGKVLVMPTPRLKSGFLLVKPGKGMEKKASSIKGAFKLGEIISIEEVPVLGLVVQGAVAVDYKGSRLGKGGGYGDKEVTTLKTHNKMGTAQIAVTVHEIQVVESLPQDPWDFSVDMIVTPQQIIRTFPFKREAVSKYMSYFLRHHPPDTISGQGFLSLDELVNLVSKRYNVTREFLTSVVETDPKGRFQIKDNKIRAVYGHSYTVRIQLPGADIGVLYHGTTERSAEKILKEGLKPKGRQKAHLSPTPDAAIEVGRRKCEYPVLLYIDAEKALKDGIIIEKASESVYVADFIPPQYISISSR